MCWETITVDLVSEFLLSSVKIVDVEFDGVINKDIDLSPPILGRCWIPRVSLPDVTLGFSIILEGFEVDGVYKVPGLVERGLLDEIEIVDIQDDVGL